MANLTKFTKDVNNISGLSDRPNEYDGLTASELKAKFDKAGVDIKTYLNSTLTSELDTSLTEIKQSATNMNTKLEKVESDVSSLTESVENGEAGASQILLKVYPVGAVYISVNDIDPGELFGGTWEKIKDTFLLASGDTYTEGATGGEAAHTLTVEEMPRHNHTQDAHSHRMASTNSDVVWDGGSGYSNSNGVWATGYKFANNANGGYTNSQQPYIHSTGGGAAHNNMPPYLVVNVWQRVS